MSSSASYAAGPSPNPPPRLDTTLARPDAAIEPAKVVGPSCDAGLMMASARYQCCSTYWATTKVTTTAHAVDTSNLRHHGRVSRHNSANSLLFAAKANLDSGSTDAVAAGTWK